MKRNLAFLLIMTSATLAQTPAVAVKPVVKPSAASVKVVPQTGAKVQPSAAKVSAAPAPKPATVSVQVAPAKPAVAAASVKPIAAAGSVVKAATTTPKSA